MALYVLDELLRRKTLIDQYESLIWTERFSAYGDLVLVIQSTSKFRALLIPETRLSFTSSSRVMEIETVEDHTDDDGKKMLKITGSSLEYMLEQRIAVSTMTPQIVIPVVDPNAPVVPVDPNAEPVPPKYEIPNWIIQGTPGDIARAVFNAICVQGLISEADKIPFVTSGSIYPPDTLAEPSAQVQMEFEIGTVYEIVKEICDTYDLGFRLIRDGDTSKLYFNVYAGNDRTSAQSSVSAVVFSPDLDNLQNITELTSNVNYKNTAYVIADSGTAVVYSTEAGPDVAGFKRRVLLVKVDTLPEFEGTDSQKAEQLQIFLKQRGMEELAKQRKVLAFDGEIPENGKYTYEIDYMLGDMVEIRNMDGAKKNVRVVEQIFVSDKQGERSYPTFTDVLYITPGSWLAWDYNQVWRDATPTWANA